MPTRWILAHDCRTSPDQDKRAGGLPFRRVNDDGRPFTCDCERRITRRDADDLVNRKLAVWKLRWVGDHRPPGVDHSELILLRVAHPTHAHAITERDMEHAYAFHGDARARERIAAFRPRRSSGL